MKYVEPILFPISPDPLTILRYAGAHGLKEIDVYVNITPYNLYYNLYYGYVDPDLQKYCLKDLSEWPYPTNDISIEDFIMFSKSMIANSESVYTQYYYLLITKYLMENPTYEQNFDRFFEWLKTPYSYAFKKGFKINILDTIESYKYNTIIFIDMWSDKQKNIIPWLNILTDSTPKFFNQSGIINKAGMFLMNGGRILVENQKNFGKIFFSLGEDFDLIDGVITKNKTPKPKTNIKQIKWL